MFVEACLLLLCHNLFFLNRFNCISFVRLFFLFRLLLLLCLPFTVAKGSEKISTVRETDKRSELFRFTASERNIDERIKRGKKKITEINEMKWKMKMKLINDLIRLSLFIFIFQFFLFSLSPLCTTLQFNFCIEIVHVFHLLVQCWHKIKRKKTTKTNDKFIVQLLVATSFYLFSFTKTKCTQESQCHVRVSEKLKCFNIERWTQIFTNAVI